MDELVVLNSKDKSNALRFNKGSFIWFEQKDSFSIRSHYLKGLIYENKGMEEIEITVENGENIKTTSKCIYNRSSIQKLPSNLTSLEIINEPELLNCFYEKFNAQAYNSFIGPVLVTINPYQRLPLNENLEEYKKKIFELDFDLLKEEPQVYSIGVEALRRLTKSNWKTNEAIVLSGESGSGKTENSKSLLKLLASCSKFSQQERSKRDSLIKYSKVIILKDEDIEKLLPTAPMGKNQGRVTKWELIEGLGSKGYKGSSKKKVSIEQKVSFIVEGIEEKILCCDPILEAFGNAKTIRNINSSRFGKLFIVLIDSTISKVKGAHIWSFLLEKSRVITQGTGERNFHVFYNLLGGADQETLDKLRLTKVTDYEYLNKSGCFSLSELDDAKMYSELKANFQKVKILEEDVFSIFKILSSILNIGNIRFEEEDRSSDQPCKILNEDFLKNISFLLELPSEEIAEALIFRIRNVAGQVISTRMTRNECCVVRDSFAKSLYEKLFQWLVRRLNHTIISPDHRGISTKSLLSEPTRSSVSILDLFGLEVFKKNSFEQFCINYSSELLLHLYNEKLFLNEETEFRNEGLSSKFNKFDFHDNKPLLSIFTDSPNGIFQLTDESSKKSTTDEALLLGIGKNHINTGKVKIPKLAKDSFIVFHSQKEVEYVVTGFRIKNKDEVPVNIKDLISKSDNEILKKIFSNIVYENEENEEAGMTKLEALRKAKNYSLSNSFRGEMDSLMKELSNSSIQFVQCIKPNDSQESGLFDLEVVLPQIRALGILENLNLQRFGFPVKMSYDDFFLKFFDLHERSDKASFTEIIKGKTQKEIKEMCKEIVKASIPELSLEVLFGETKGFLSLIANSALENCLKKKLSIKDEFAKKIQRRYITYKYQVRFRRAIKGIKMIQRLFRVRIEHNKFKYSIRMVKKLQRWWRRILFRKNLQNGLKIWKEKVHAATKIQSFVKKRFWQTRFGKIKRGVHKFKVYAVSFLSNLRNKKLSFCQEIVKRIIFENAWRIISQRWQHDAAIMIQKNFRGYLARKRNSEKVVKILKAKENFILNKSAIAIQRIYRGHRIRRNIRIVVMAITKIQAFLKMKFARRKYLKQRNAAKIIQAAVRKFILSKLLMKDAWSNFHTEFIDNLEAMRAFESQELLKNEHAINHSNNSTSVMTDGDDDSVWESLLMSSYEERKGGGGRVKNNNQEMDPSRKIRVFLLIIDFDILGDISEVYQQSWSKSFFSAGKQAFAYDQAKLHTFSVGESFSTVLTDLGKLYSWGSNDFKELGRPSADDVALVELPEAIDRVICGESHGFAVTEEGTLYSWGNNLEGNLGLGDCHPRSSLTKVPIKRVKNIASRSSYNVCSTYDGKLFCWPFTSATIKKMYKPVEIPVSEKIDKVECGNNFVVLLSTVGHVFTFGKDNRNGQLGHGDTEPRIIPTVIRSLLQDKVVNISAGFKHVAIRTGLGKIYTWGAGDAGQLCNGTFKGEKTPYLIPYENFSPPGSKPLQIKASFRSTVILVEPNKVFWFGSNGSIKKNNLPSEIDLFHLLKLNDPRELERFIPLRVITSYSRTLSVTGLTMADTTRLPEHWTITSKICNNLSLKWDYESIYPPVVDAVSKYFSFRQLERSIHHEHEKKKIIPTETQQKPLSREEQDKLIELFEFIGETGKGSSRLLSPKSRFNPTYEMYKASPMKKNKKLDEQKEVKLRYIKEKVFMLMNTEKRLWNRKDEEFMRRLADPKIQSILKKIE